MEGILNDFGGRCCPIGTALRPLYYPPSPRMHAGTDAVLIIPADRVEAWSGTGAPGSQLYYRRRFSRLAACDSGRTDLKNAGARPGTETNGVVGEANSDSVQGKWCGNPGAAADTGSRSNWHAACNRMRLPDWICCAPAASSGAAYRIVDTLSHAIWRNFQHCTHGKLACP